MKIVVDLNEPGSITKALEELEKARKEIKAFARELTEELVKRGAQVASVKYSMAEYAGFNDVTTGFKLSKGGMTGTVYARGNAVLFIEFGTGRMRADNETERADIISGGESLKGHGQYGYGMGDSMSGWFYRGTIGRNPPEGTEKSTTNPKSIHTYGNNANSSMWLSKFAMEEMFSEVVQEVWGRRAR